MEHFRFFYTHLSAWRDGHGYYNGCSYRSAKWRFVDFHYNRHRLGRQNMCPMWNRIFRSSVCAVGYMNFFVKPAGQRYRRRLLGNYLFNYSVHILRANWMSSSEQRQDIFRSDYRANKVAVVSRFCGPAKRQVWLLESRVFLAAEKRGPRRRSLSTCFQERRSKETFLPRRGVMRR